VTYVLVVEDDVRVREVCVTRSPMKGCGMREPCLVLLDLLMPIMNGWEFRSRQLADPRLRDVPVIVMTATTNIPEAKIEANALLQEPVDLDLLLRTVSQHALPREP